MPARQDSVRKAPGGEGAERRDFTSHVRRRAGPKGRSAAGAQAQNPADAGF
jgi:hypothetical protein